MGFHTHTPRLGIDSCRMVEHGGKEMQFDHEKLEVYQRAIDFVALADKIVTELPKGRAYLADQLQRAATSVPLNIAEGAGEYSRNDKARFYRMAKRSATECAAILDVCRRLELVESQYLDTGRDLLLRLVSMLVSLARRLSASGRGTGKGTGKGKEQD